MAIYYAGRGRLSDVLRKFKEEYLSGLSQEDLESDVTLRLISASEIKKMTDMSDRELRDHIVRMMEEF
jgi:hypothetical protein